MTAGNKNRIDIERYRNLVVVRGISHQDGPPGINRVAPQQSVSHVDLGNGKVVLNSLDIEEAFPYPGAPERRLESAVVARGKNHIATTGTLNARQRLLNRIMQGALAHASKVLPDELVRESLEGFSGKIEPGPPVVVGHGKVKNFPVAF